MDTSSSKDGKVYMFSALQARFHDQPNGPAVFTTVVGRKPSAAHYFLNDNDEVLELCASLRLHSTRANRNRSMGDLPRHERVWTSKPLAMPTAIGEGGTPLSLHRTAGR